MANIPDLSPEELEQMLEKAKRELQEKLDKMTPEERQRAQIAAQNLIEEDQAQQKKLLEDAAAIIGRPAPQTAPKFCSSCGAPADGGKFCAYCGRPL